MLMLIGKKKKANQQAIRSNFLRKATFKIYNNVTDSDQYFATCVSIILY